MFWALKHDLKQERPSTLLHARSMNLSYTDQACLSAGLDRTSRSPVRQGSPARSLQGKTLNPKP